MSSDSCLFCRIAKGEIPSFKIHEDEKFLAILDISQFTEGHCLVIPKDHYETIWDFPDIGKLYDFIQKVGNNFKEKGFEYVDTMTFGRMIHHAHVHLIPHNNDNVDWKRALAVLGEYQHDPDRNPSKEEGDALVKKYGS